MKQWLMLSLAAAATVAAQQAPQPPQPPRQPRTPEPRSYSFSFSSDNRARLGVIVNTAANADSDKLGARLEGVTPGGPADKAGLKAGDVITKFNGTALGGLVAENDEESGPGMKLVQLAHRLDTGDTVKLEYRRGADTKAATIVAQDLDDDNNMATTWMRMPHVEVAPPAIEMPRIQVNPFMSGMNFSVCMGESWCEMEMVKLNPDLGAYFGTSDGVLVVRAPEDSTIPLKAGDVILSIGGRKATDVEHATRILHSYDGGDTVSIDIVRRQKHQTVTWVIPTEEEHMRRMQRSHPRHSPEDEEQGAAIRRLRDRLKRFAELRVV